jgi:hypothetical protein
MPAVAEVVEEAEAEAIAGAGVIPLSIPMGDQFRQIDPSRYA